MVIKQGNIFKFFIFTFLLTSYIGNQKDALKRRNRKRDEKTHMEPGDLRKKLLIGKCHNDKKLWTKPQNVRSLTRKL